MDHAEQDSHAACTLEVTLVWRLCRWSSGSMAQGVHACMHRRLPAQLGRGIRGRPAAGHAGPAAVHLGRPRASHRPILGGLLLGDQVPPPVSARPATHTTDTAVLPSCVDPCTPPAAGSCLSCLCKACVHACSQESTCLMADQDVDPGRLHKYPRSVPGFERVCPHLPCRPGQRLSDHSDAQTPRLGSPKAPRGASAGIDGSASASHDGGRGLRAWLSSNGRQGDGLAGAVLLPLMGCAAN